VPLLPEFSMIPRRRLRSKPPSKKAIAQDLGVIGQRDQDKHCYDRKHREGYDQPVW
jgi:hypothetical protein